MQRFLLLFVGVLAVGIFLGTLPPVEHWASEPWGVVLASLAHWILSIWDTGTIQAGNVLRDAGSGFAVAVDAECNGIDVVIVLWAAIIAFPSSLRSKAFGMLFGLLALQSLNLVRILSLFYIGTWNEEAFTWVHHNLWQGLMILGVLLTFMLWLRLSASPRGWASSGRGS